MATIRGAFVLAATAFVLALAAAHARAGTTGGLPHALPPEARARVLAAADGTGLAPWQRDLMRSIAGAARAKGTAAAASDGEWSRLGPPPGRRGSCAVFDPSRRRMIVFGGVGTYWPPLNDVWALSLDDSPAWTQLVAEGTPPSGRIDATAVYDPAGDRMIVFGGQDASNFLNDVWELRFAGTPRWTALAPAGVPPVGRSQCGAVYDPDSARMIVFGGFDYFSPQRNDAWALSLSGPLQWTPLAAEGAPPPGLANPGVVYDPVHHSLVVVGGTIFNGAYTRQNKTWFLTLQGAPKWNLLDTTATAPPERSDPWMVYDSSRQRAVVFGGDYYLGDTWALALGDTIGWSPLAPRDSVPAAREGYVAVYDPKGDRMVIYGGSLALDEAWALSFGDSAWRRLAPSDSPPQVLDDACVAYDPVRDRLIAFGGYSTFPGSGYSGDTWALSLAGSPSWSRLAAAGDAPPARAYAGTAYDARRDRMLVFGGAGGGPYPDYKNDLWALDLSGTPTWTQLHPAGTPPDGRYSHAMIVDPVRDRLLIFGGYSYTQGLLNDLWEVSLGESPSWTPIVAAGSPPGARESHRAVYDPVRDRMLVFGGDSYTGNLNETWALDLGAGPQWLALTPTGQGPSYRRGCTLAYDPIRDRMVVFGGFGGAVQSYLSAPLNDTWAMSLAGGEAWQRLFPSGAPPGGRSRQASAYDAPRDRLVVFGGEGAAASATSDAWVLAWSAGAAPAQTAAPAAGCPGDAVRQPGITQALRFALSQPVGGVRAVEWRLRGARAWPGLPLAGVQLVSAAAPETIEVPVPVPDSVAAGPQSLAFDAWYAGGPRADVGCTLVLEDGSTAALVSLLSVVADPDRVTLAWRLGAPPAGAPHVWRSSGSGEWSDVGAATLLDAEQVAFEDRSVVPGGRYGYRLAGDDGVTWSGSEAWVSVPARLALAIALPRPHPARGELRVTVALPSAEAARLTVLDVAGRRVAVQDLASAGPGRHEITVAGGRALPPGAYLLRLEQGSAHVQLRVVVVR